MNPCNFIEDSVKALLKASHIPTSVLGGSKRTKPSKDDPQWVAGHTFFRRASVIYRLLKPLCLPQSFHANRYREERHDELHGDEGFNEGFFFLRNAGPGLVVFGFWCNNACIWHLVDVLLYIQIGKSLYDNCTSSLYSIMITYWDGPYLPYLSTYLFGCFNPLEKYACQIGPSPQVRFKIQKCLKAPPSYLVKSSLL